MRATINGRLESEVGDLFAEHGAYLADHIDRYAVEMTPELAKIILDANDANYRKLDRARVIRYGKEMREGTWKYNKESICFNSSGKLIDGQHRLAAIEKSGVTIKMEVIDGIDEHLGVDKCKPRTLSQELAYRGESNATRIGAALRLLHCYLDGSLATGNRSASDSACLALLEEHPMIRDSIKVSSSFKLKQGRKAWLGTMHYLCSMADAEQAYIFFDEVATGEGLNATDPSFALRSLIIDQETLSKDRRVDSVRLMGMASKAWRAYREDRPIKRGSSGISWRRTGATREGFPLVDGCPLNPTEDEDR